MRANFEQMVWFIRSTNLCIPFFVLVFFEGLKGPTTNIYGAHFLKLNGKLTGASV